MTDALARWYVREPERWYVREPERWYVREPERWYVREPEWCRTGVVSESLG